MRIYELAKELGVDNKVVIVKAQELGYRDKTSHSHSLDDKQVETLRRALLRQATGALSNGTTKSAAVSVPDQKGTVVRRVTRGEDTFVEQRAGGVIIRRRQGTGTDGSINNNNSSKSSTVSVRTATSSGGQFSVASGSLKGISDSSPKESLSKESEDSDLKSVGSVKNTPNQQGNLEVNSGKTSGKIGAGYVVVSNEGERHELALAKSFAGNVSDKSLSEVGAVQNSDVEQLVARVRGKVEESDTMSGSSAPEAQHDEFQILDGKRRETSFLFTEDELTPEEEEADATSDNLEVVGSATVDNHALLGLQVDEANVRQFEELDPTDDLDEEPAADEQLLVVTVEPEEIASEIEEEQEEEAHVARGKSSVNLDMEESTIGTRVTPKASGPRILGRIELPIHRKAAKVEAKRTSSTPGVVATSAVSSSVLSNASTISRIGVPTILDDEDDETARKGRGKSRKREISRIDLIDYDGREGSRRSTRSLKSSKGGKDLIKGASVAEVKGPKASKRVIKLADAITVGELARQLSLKAGEVMQKLMSLGVLATINQSIDRDTATIIADEFGYQVENTAFDEDIFKEELVEDDVTKLLPRPPVVTVMGHVDHGKTSLLDYIRKSSVAEREHGGITQHIGAYQVKTAEGKAVTFIDTPGHAAFTSMRARGAKVTDIVILVVAADDGVMPQTIEAINHAKAAEVPIVVAVNKMDKRDANPDRVKQQLAEYGLQPEDWGGDTMFFPVSALKGDGVAELIDGILLLADIRELKANPERRARGVVVEASQERGRGSVATVLVQSGTLRIGDIFVAGTDYGRVRSMENERGERIDEAGPSMPVEISGFNAPPQAGDDFFIVLEEGQAREIASHRLEKAAVIDRARASGPISLEEFSRRASSEEPEELNVIAKTDVHGSLEAVSAALLALSTDKVRVRVLHGGVGGVTENDVQLAVASKAIVVGFGVRGEVRALAEAERLGIQVRFYRVIYELLDDIKKAMVGLLDPIKEEVSLGRAEVRNSFVVPKIGTIAGCYISDGNVRRGAHVRVVRDGRLIYTGRMSSLRRFKDDVKEVQSGYECGIGVENFNDIKVGDILEVFEVREVAATL
jgi:translation initiation factor IF-2